MTPQMFTLPVKVSACFRSSSSVQNIHVHETVTATEQVRDEAGAQALADAAGAAVMKARTVLTACSVEHIAASWHCKVVALSKKKGGAEELQHPILVSGGDRVAGGVWHGERYTLLSA